VKKKSKDKKKKKSSKDKDKGKNKEREKRKTDQEQSSIPSTVANSESERRKSEAPSKEDKGHAHGWEDTIKNEKIYLRPTKTYDFVDYFFQKEGNIVVLKNEGIDFQILCTSNDKVCFHECLR